MITVAKISQFESKMNKISAYEYFLGFSNNYISVQNKFYLDVLYEYA